MYDIWKKQAINELEAYEARKQALINITDQLRELEQKITAIHSPAADSVSVHGSNGRKDDAYLNNIVTRDLLRVNLKDTRRSVNRVAGALSVLSDDEKSLLQRFFIAPEDGVVFNIADEKHVDRKTVYRMKDLALTKFTIAMYGNK